jgi:hypothetical protein
MICARLHAWPSSLDLDRLANERKRIRCVFRYWLHAEGFKSSDMNVTSSDLYPPINTLKPIAEDVWIVDGPIIRFGPRWFQFPFPTRMTILRLDGRLFVHSPTAIIPTLRAELARLGDVQWIVGPNHLHYWWIPDWHRAFPSAAVFLAPGIGAQARGRIDFPCTELVTDHGYPWDDTVTTLPIQSSYLTEVAFFHRPSRTLVLTDLIENFELTKVRSPLQRLLVRIGGVAYPCGSTSKDMRMTFRKHRSELRRAIETMINWKPARVVFAHGQWFERNADAELRRAFAWALRGEER